MTWKTIVDSSQVQQYTKSVAICVPTNGLVHAEFAYCLANLIQRCEAEKIKINLVMHNGTILSEQRQKIALEALKLYSPDYLFWIDSDITFPDNTLIKLLAAEKDVVCAAYSKRMPPFIPTVFSDIDPVIPVEINGKLQRARFAGMGCMLVSAVVMQTLPMPWFPLLWHEASQSWHGEDMGFCSLLEFCNIELWCDTALSLEIGHLGIRKHLLDLED